MFHAQGAAVKEARVDVKNKKQAREAGAQWAWQEGRKKKVEAAPRYCHGPFLGHVMPVTIGGF